MGWLEDGAEEAGALRAADADGRVGRVVEAPQGCFALLALVDELGAEGEVVFFVEHLFLFGADGWGYWWLLLLLLLRWGRHGGLGVLLLESELGGRC